VPEDGKTYAAPRILSLGASVSIDDPTKIDGAGIDKDGRYVVLMISDQLEWSEEGEHLLMLQEKLNAYDEFIASGALIRKMPKARGLPAIIRIYGKFPLSRQAEKFLESARSIFANDGIAVEFALSSDQTQGQ
jgi:hypothetical protein